MKVTKRTIFLSVILFLFAGSLSATDKRLRAMGEMKIAIPDIDNQVNLYQWAGNSAWLKINDSLNWMRYSANSLNDWGQLKRKWDAEKTRNNFFSFSGQKHITDSQVFYGEIRYNWDYRFGVDQTIEKTPYAPDPFVLADSNSGDLSYLGPQALVIFNHQLSSRFYWGASFYYNINRGLKNTFTRPEIINRQIEGSLDMAYRLNDRLTLGMSFRPSYIQDITKLVKQPDGSEPITYRYRGEFEFRQKTGNNERHADYEGYDFSGQFSYQSRTWETVILGGYQYRWHEIYDSPTRRLYDGYYQGEGYFGRAALRYHRGLRKQTTIALDYQFNYLEDWAKEPIAGLLFNQAYYRNHQAALGFSHRFQIAPLETALELHYDLSNPYEADYLAHLKRKGYIRNFEMHAGGEYRISNRFSLRAGYIYKRYDEQKVWNYFGDNEGSGVTFGAGYYFKKIELDLYGRYGQMSSLVNGDAWRQSLFFMIQLKNYF